MSLGRRPSTATSSHESSLLSRYYDQQTLTTPTYVQTTSSNSAPSSPTAGRTRGRTFSEAPSPCLASRAYSSRPSPLKSIHDSPPGPTSPLSSPKLFDMKRLLSKPAPPYARTQGYGSGSESDGAALSEHGGEGKGKGKELMRNNGMPHDLSKSTSSLDIHVDMNTGVPLDLDLTSPGPNTSINSLPSMNSAPSRNDTHNFAALPSPNMDPPKPPPPSKRTRNVLRRRPSNPTAPPNSNRSPATTRSPQSPLSSSFRSPESDPQMTTMTRTRAMTTSTQPLHRSAPTSPIQRLADTRDAHQIPGRTTNIDSRAYGTRDPRVHEQARRSPDIRHRDGDESQPQHRHPSKSQGRNVPGSELRGSHLTPAGAVVEAYKRQESERLSGGSGESGSASGSHSGGGGRKGDRVRRNEAEAEEEEASAPYYTVVGSSSERVRADHDERSWEGYQWEPTGVGRRSLSTGADAEGSASASASASKPGLAKTLTRKVSGRWRKGGETVPGEEGDKVTQSETDRGRASLQERKVGRFSNVGVGVGREEKVKNQRSLRVSIDKFVDGMGMGMSESQTTVAQQPVASQGEVDPEPEIEMEATCRPPLKSRKSEPGGGSGGSGSKIWKLVKRISSSGLRDKFRDTTPVEAPPVPALPKDYQTRSSPSGLGHSSSMGMGAVHHRQDQRTGSSSIPSTPPGGISRFIQRSSSTGISGVSGSGTPSPNIVVGGGGSRSRRKVSVAVGTVTMPVGSSKKSSTSLPLRHSSSSTPVRSGGTTTTNISSPSSSSTSHSGHPQQQRSATTPSSSPISSDVASTRFFNRPSARSSSSSLSGSGDGNTLPVPMLPIPTNVIVGQHIIPPSELLYRMHTEDNAKDKESSSMSMSGTSKLNLKLNIPLNSNSDHRDNTSDDWMIRHTPAVELMPLPVPPRRSTPRPTIVRRNSYDSVHQRSESPGIPSFSTVNPINTFGPSSRRASSDARKPLLSQFSSGSSSGDHPDYLPLLPPPRPTRSSQRPASRPSTTQSTPTSTSPSIFSPRKRREIPEFPASTSTTDDLEYPKRRSTGGYSNASASTMRPLAVGVGVVGGRRSGSVVSSESPLPLSSPVNWKEAGEQKVLTEQEKAERWDDLMERSARAGGTLHLGAGGGEDGLSSDMLRFEGSESERE